MLFYHLLNQVPRHHCCVVEELFVEQANPVGAIHAAVAVHSEPKYSLGVFLFAPLVLDVVNRGALDSLEPHAAAAKQQVF